MRKLTLFMLLLFTAFPVWVEGQWTVQTVPNTRLQSNDIHVSDPDNYLSDSAEMNINTALCAIRDQADVFVVTLSSIGEVEPKRFATQLFNDWGIGDAETNNGVLLLFVEDQHALEFETGYGAEETLTDARCERIFRNTIVPYFRNGDYEGGLCAGVADIVTVYGGEIPDGLMTTLPESSDFADEEFDGSILLLVLVAMMAMLLPFAGFAFWLAKRKEKKAAASERPTFEEAGATYIDGVKAAWTGSPWVGKGCLGGLMIGFSFFVFICLGAAIMALAFPDSGDTWLSVGTCLISLVLYFTWVCFRQNQRVLKTADRLAKQTINQKAVYKTAIEHGGNRAATWVAPWLGWVYYLIFKKRMNQSGECACPVCQSALRKDNYFSLPEVHKKEHQLGALRFTPYRCANGHEIVLREKGGQYSKFQTCSKCGAFTLMLTQTKTIREASYSLNGEKENTYVCQNCGDIVTKTLIIPKLVHYTGGGYSSGSSSSHSYSSHRSSSSHSSRGSFGGGRSGGGGYSGRW